MKKIATTIILLLILFSSCFSQNKTEVTQFKLRGPEVVREPIVIDSVDLNGKKFTPTQLLNFNTNNFAVKDFSDTVLPSSPDGLAVGSLIFYLNNQDFIKGNIDIKGIKDYKIIVDNQELNGGRLKLEPSHHTFEIKFLSAPNSNDSIKVTLNTNKAIKTTTSSLHPFNLQDMLYGKRISSASISPNGKYIIINYTTTNKKGNSSREAVIKELANGKIITKGSSFRWMPKSNLYWWEQRSDEKREIYTGDPQSGETKKWIENIPNGGITISPNEEYLVINSSNRGPREDPNVYQIIDPDDRQAGWRDRGYLIKYDIKSGVAEKITYGNHTSSLYDISSDGKWLLIGISNRQITKRPSNSTTFLRVDSKSFAIDTLIDRAIFINGAEFSPNGKQILFKGGPEAFNSIGKTTRKDGVSNSYDMQLFLYDIEGKSVKSLTRQFNPSIENYTWVEKDNMIYTTVTEGEFKRLYKISPVSGKVEKIDTEVDVINNYSLSPESGIICYVGGRATAPVKLYTINLKNKSKGEFMEDCTKDIYKDVEIGECKEWSFISRLNDKIEGRFYLPPDFDPNKKYPLIVNYYGGCTPTQRALEGRYPQAYYASLGYVVYVLQPSGCIGFGQEFSSRHVETWGQYTADDIIEGVKKFCSEHSFIDQSKIGCIGASYGGFMTQYLQTVTDIFACAISHAGISNIASYWGEGYWGYSYGHVASGESYPWNNKDMYVNQSPLFNADKINTPLLLLHGSDDTNVPHIESIQMFNALKILGKEVAFIEVKGENHWILEYGKRIKWSNTIMAWFQKYLKDDPTWWEEIYPDKFL